MSRGPKYGDPLTEREREIHALLMTGVSEKELAYGRGMTIYGLRFHSNRICRKLGVSGRVELMALEIGKWREAYGREIERK